MIAAHAQREMNLFEETRSEYLEKARSAAIEIVRTFGEVTVDDVRQIAPPPDSVDPRVMGAIFRESRWVIKGYQKSTRKECHGRPVATFTLKKWQ